MKTIKQERRRDSFLSEIAKRFKQERRLSRAFTEQTERVTDNANYLNKLDWRLDKIIRQKKEELQKLVTTHRRAMVDLKQKEKLEQLRHKIWKQNAAVVDQIKMQEQIKIRKLDTHRQNKKELALRFQKEKQTFSLRKKQKDADMYRRNKQIVMNISKFYFNAQEKKKQREQSKDNLKIKDIEISIKLVKQKLKQKSRQKQQSQRKIKILAESTGKKELLLQEIETIIQDIKLKSKFKQNTCQQMQCHRLHRSLMDRSCRRRYHTSMGQNEENETNYKTFESKKESMSTNLGACK